MLVFYLYKKKNYSCYLLLHIFTASSKYILSINTCTYISHSADKDTTPGGKRGILYNIDISFCTAHAYLCDLLLQKYIFGCNGNISISIPLDYGCTRWMNRPSYLRIYNNLSIIDDVLFNIWKCKKMFFNFFCLLSPVLFALFARNTILKPCCIKNVHFKRDEAHKYWFIFVILKCIYERICMLM